MRRTPRRALGICSGARVERRYWIGLYEYLVTSASMPRVGAREVTISRRLPPVVKLGMGISVVSLVLVGIGAGRRKHTLFAPAAERKQHLT